MGHYVCASLLKAITALGETSVQEVVGMVTGLLLVPQVPQRDPWLHEDRGAGPPAEVSERGTLFPTRQEITPTCVSHKLWAGQTGKCRPHHSESLVSPTAHYDKCVINLREQFKPDMSQVLDCIFSHAQVAKKNQLVIMLIVRWGPAPQVGVGWGLFFLPLLHLLSPSLG